MTGQPSPYSDKGSVERLELAILQPIFNRACVDLREVKALAKGRLETVLEFEAKLSTLRQEHETLRVLVLRYFANDGSEGTYDAIKLWTLREELRKAAGKY